MAKEIKIKLKNADKLEFELLEDANKGDYIDLYSAYDKTSLEPLKEILSNQKEKIIEEWRKEATKEIKDNAINSFKASDEYLKINQENQKYKLENEDLNKKLAEDKKQLKLEAINEYKNSDEYKKIINEVNKKETEIAKLQEVAKNEVLKFKETDEYKNLLKQQEEIKELNHQIKTINENKQLEIENQVALSKDKIIQEYKNTKDYKELLETIKFQRENLDKKNQEITSLNKDKDNAVLIYKDSKEFKELLAQEQKNKDLSKEIANINNKKALEIKNAVLEAKDSTIKEYKESKEYLDLINENKNQAKELNKITNDNILLKNENEELKNQRNLKSNKLIGEDLENWLSQQYQEDLESVLEDSIWQKTNVVHDGTKPDFIFKVKSNIEEITDENDPAYYLGKVVIEAKSERYDSSNRTKNKEFLPKLKKDMDNLGGDYALLVTELESNDIFSIKTSREFPNIFIVRPEWTMSLLKILRYIFLRKKALIKQEWTFKEKNDILRDFEEFKNNILENAFRKINSNLEEIQKQAENIKVAADKILDNQRKIFDTHMNTIKNSINKFKIENKVTKRIAKLDNQQQNHEEELVLEKELVNKEE